MSLDLTDDKSTLVQVMAWCRQATSHYMSQCWPRSLSPYGVAKPQWVKYWVRMDSCDTFSSTYQDCSVTHSSTYRRVLVWLLVSYCGVNTECQSLTIIKKQVLCLSYNISISVYVIFPCFTHISMLYSFLWFHFAAEHTVSQKYKSQLKQNTHSIIVCERCQLSINTQFCCPDAIVYLLI